MKNTFFGWLPLVACAILINAGCDSPSDPVTPTLEIYTELDEGSSVPLLNGGEIQVEVGEFVDSVRIDSVRVLFSRIVLHQSKTDTTEGPRNVKAGPFVLTWSARGLRRDLGADIEAGLYRQMKMEMHTFSGSEASQYMGHPVFGDFAVGKRSTMIIDGVAYVDGSVQPFRVTSEKRSNIFVEFEPPLEVTEAGTQGIVMSMDMIASLKTSGKFRNPLSPKALEAIEGGLWSFTKVRKR